MKIIKDKYVLAVEYLVAHPDEILEAWGEPRTHPAGCLFDYTGSMSGCLTQVRNEETNASNQRLTQEIRRDQRIPEYEGDITIKDLPVFVKWQRKLDELKIDRGP